MAHILGHWLTRASMGLVLLTLGACGTSRPAATGTSAATREVSAPLGAAFALLTDNRLVALRPGDGGVIAELQLAPDPGTADVGAGHYLASSQDGTRLFALLAAPPGAAEQILAAIDTAASTVRATYAVPREGAIFRSVAVGPQTGRIYLFGNRSTTSQPSGAVPTAADVVVAVLDPGDGAVRTRWTVREAAGFDWRVYQGVVSDDEQRFFISYHGPNTGGIDWYDLTAGTPRRCPSPPEANAGCLSAHGSFDLYGGGLLVATGVPSSSPSTRMGRCGRDSTPDWWATT